MKVRNTVISVLTCIFLLGPAALYISEEKLHLELSPWLTAEGAMYLQGASSNVDFKDCISGEAILSMEFQDSFSKLLGNYIPAKASALLDTAMLQRAAIASSNLLFNWKCYPTYFGEKSAVYAPDGNSLLSWPVQDLESHIQGINAFGELTKAFAEAHPDKRICIVIPDYPGTTLANPAIDYLDECLTTETCKETLSSQLDGLDNVHIACIFYNNLED